MLGGVTDDRRRGYSTIETTSGPAGLDVSAPHAPRPDSTKRAMPAGFAPPASNVLRVPVSERAFDLRLLVPANDRKFSPRPVLTSAGA